MLDFTAILNAAKALGASVEDVPEGDGPSSEHLVIPPRFRTAAMAGVLRRQGLTGMAERIERPVTLNVAAPYGGKVLLAKAISAGAGHPAPPFVLCARNPIEQAVHYSVHWDVRDLFRRLRAALDHPVDAAITLYCHFSDGNHTLVQLEHIAESGSATLDIRCDIILLRPVLSLVVGNRRSEFLFGDRLLT